MKTSRKKARPHLDVPDVWDGLMEHNSNVLFEAFYHESQMLFQKFLKGDATKNDKRAVGHFLVDIGAVQLEVKNKGKKKDSWDTVEVHYNRIYPQGTSLTIEAPRYATDVSKGRKTPKGREIAASGIVTTKIEPLQDASREDLSWTAGDVYDDDGMAGDEDNDDDAGDRFVIDVDESNAVGEDETEGAVSEKVVVKKKGNRPAPLVVHKCTICSSIFSTIWELDMHVTRCIVKSEENLIYSCHMCPKFYKARTSMSIHLHQEHDIPVTEVVEKLPTLRGPRWERPKGMPGRKRTVGSMEQGEGSSATKRRSSMMKRTRSGRLLVGKGIFDGTKKTDKEAKSLSAEEEETRGDDAPGPDSKEDDCTLHLDGKETSSEPGTEAGLNIEAALGEQHHVPVAQDDLGGGGDDQDSSEKGQHDADAIGSSTDTIESSGSHNESSLLATSSIEKGGDEANQMEQVDRVEEGGDTPDISGSLQEAGIVEDDSVKVVNSPHDPAVSQVIDEVKGGEVSDREGEDCDVLDQESDEDSSEESAAQEEDLSQNSFAENQAGEASGTERGGKRRRKYEDQNSLFACQLCGDEFNNRNSVHLHVRKKHFKDSFKCNTCGKVYKDMNTYMKHLKTHGKPTKQKEIKEHVCPFCSKTFKHKGFYRRHLEDHEADSNFPNFVCKYCNVKLCSKATLQKHVNSRHTKELKYPCTFCDKVYYIKHQLSSHLKLHIAGKQWKCDQCNSAYVEKWSLEMHKKNVHNNTEFFLCDLCGTTYKSLGNLRQHNQTAHTVGFKFTCDTCGKQFKRKTHMNAHMKVHLDVRPHKCEVCDKNFRTRTNLAVHMKWHNNEREFKCRICDMCFLTKGNLDKHMQKHAETKSHFCTECGYGCTDFTMLRKHLATTHNIIVESIVTKSEGKTYRRGGNGGTPKAPRSRKKAQAQNEQVQIEVKVQMEQPSGPPEVEQATASLCVLPVVTDPHFPSNEAMASAVPVANYSAPPPVHHFAANEPMHTFANVAVSSIASVPVSGTPGMPGNYTYTREIPNPTCDEEGQAIATQAFMNMILR